LQSVAPTRCNPSLQIFANGTWTSLTLDQKIEHYKALKDRITDQITLDGIGELIAELLAKKAALHPERRE
jgi:hypothetical protein